MLERELVNGSTGDVIKCEGSVDVLDVVEEMEKVQIVLFGDANAVISEPKMKICYVWWNQISPLHITQNRYEPFLNSFNLLGLLLLWISCVCQQKLGKVRLGDFAFFVGIFALKFECENFTLKLMLKVEELFNRQLLIELRSEKVATECAVDALQFCWVERDEKFRITSQAQVAESWTKSKSTTTTTTRILWCWKLRKSWRRNLKRKKLIKAARRKFSQIRISQNYSCVKITHNIIRYRKISITFFQRKINSQRKNNK